MQRVLGSGSNGVVFAVTCVHEQAPYPDKTYALKVLWCCSVLVLLVVVAEALCSAHDRRVCGEGRPCNWGSLGGEAL